MEYHRGYATLRMHLQLYIYNQIKFQNLLKKMSRITEELLRKRAEHNQGCLTTLQQISLHQQELVKIENLDKLCRHLKILYLQNNIIQKMQNLNKLKQLEYLNMALNNITKIENIQGCQSLHKLDMTVNFIDVINLHQSVNNLAKLPVLKEIYLTGNPCQSWVGCKDYVVAHIDTLQTYNGEVVTPSMRIKAKQMLPSLKASLFQAIQKRKLELRQQQYDEEERRKKEQFMSQEEKAKQKSPYTPQMRKEMYEKMAEQKEQKERQRNPEKFKPQKSIQMYNKEGEIRQCNEGKFKFSLREYDDPDYTFFSIEVPKHLQTSQLQVNINPKWVSVRIKKQLTQLKLSQEIIVHQSKSQRSQLTGELLISMKKLSSHEFLRRTKEKEIAKKRKQQQQKKQKQKQERQKRLRLCDQYEKRMQKEEDQIPDLE